MSSWSPARTKHSAQYVMSHTRRPVAGVTNVPFLSSDSFRVSGEISGVKANRVLILGIVVGALDTEPSTAWDPGRLSSRTRERENEQSRMRS